MKKLTILILLVLVGTFCSFSLPPVAAGEGEATLPPADAPKPAEPPPAPATPIAPAPAPVAAPAAEAPATPAAPAVNPAGGQGAASGTVAPPAPVSIPVSETKSLAEECAPFRAVMQANMDIHGTAAQETYRDKVSVYLSESMGKDYGLSCSKIIYCLRTNPAAVTKDRKMKRALEIEPLVIYTLRDHYSDCIIEGTDGLDLLMKYTTMVYKWIVSIVGAVCILIIIVSGIQVSMGGLSQEEVSQAKDRIGRSLMGLVVLFLSAFILYTINPIFYQ